MLVSSLRCCLKEAHHSIKSGPGCTHAKAHKWERHSESPSAAGRFAPLGHKSRELNIGQRVSPGRLSALVRGRQTEAVLEANKPFSRRRKSQPGARRTEDLLPFRSPGWSRKEEEEEEGTAGTKWPRPRYTSSSTALRTIEVNQF